MIIDITNLPATQEIIVRPKNTVKLLCTGATAWSIAGPAGSGSIDATTGIFTAPDTITTQVQLTVTANVPGGVSKSATILLSPPNVVTPASVDLDVGQQQSFSFAPSGPAVKWSIEPAGRGEISEAGVYTAPAEIAMMPLACWKRFIRCFFAVDANAAPPQSRWQRFISCFTATGCRRPEYTVVVTAHWENLTTEFANATIHLNDAPRQIRKLIWYWIIVGIVSSVSVIVLGSKLCVPTPSLMVVVSPSIVTLTGLQTQQFTATVVGATDEVTRAVIWDQPEMGSLSNGLYVLTNAVKTAQSITIRAVCMANSKRSGTATVLVSPDGSLTLRPPVAEAHPSQILQFSAEPGANLEWSVIPANAGTISPAGQYLAPEFVDRPRRATIHARNTQNPAIQAGANLLITPSAEICARAPLRLLVFVYMMGVLGSTLYAVTSFVVYLGNRKFLVSWYRWYFFRPFMGGGLALMFYFIIGGGFVNGETTDNVYRTVAFAGLVGMFAEHFNAKLKDLVEALMPVKSDTRKDKANHDQP
jgi:hypothetical protein